MDTRTAGNLHLGDILQAAAVPHDDVLVIRHTVTSDGLRADVDPDGPELLRYTREQGLTGSKIGKEPPRYWLNFLATSGRRARFLTAFENHGEVLSARTSEHRFFDLRPSQAFSALRNRLVIEWFGDTVNWAKTGSNARTMSVIEITQLRPRPFPGFDGLLVDYNDLQVIVDDAQYTDWQTALAAVKGIYLISDASTGGLYVGKADGMSGILGRWREYARSGHGHNVGLRELDALDPKHRQNFRFSILRVFAPSAPSMLIDAAENHYKTALLTRRHGLNRN